MLNIADWAYVDLSLISVDTESTVLNECRLDIRWLSLYILLWGMMVRAVKFVSCGYLHGYIISILKFVNLIPHICPDSRYDKEILKLSKLS